MIPRRALQIPLVPAKAGTQSILDSRFRGNERRLNGDFVALEKQGVMPATSAGMTGEGSELTQRRGDSRVLLEILGRRVVARIDRVLEEFVLLVGPELADVGIGLDHRVDVSPVLLLDLAEVDVADHVAELVEPHRAAQGVRNLRLPERLHEGFFVLGLAADRLERVVEDLAAEIGLGGLDAGIGLVVAPDRLYESI